MSSPKTYERQIVYKWSLPDLITYIDYKYSEYRLVQIVETDSVFYAILEREV